MCGRLFISISFNQVTPMPILPLLCNKASKSFKRYIRSQSFSKETYIRLVTGKVKANWSSPKQGGYSNAHTVPTLLAI